MAVTPPKNKTQPKPQAKKTFKTVAQEQRRTSAEVTRERRSQEEARKQREEEDAIYLMIYGPESA